jgi:hypothetical protein
MSKRIFIVFLVACIPYMMYGQSAFGDSEEKTSIVLNTGGVAQINIKDASIKIGYLYRKSDKPFRLGIQLTGKITNGLGSLVENGEISPEAKFNLSLGYQWLLSKETSGKTPGTIVDDWFTIRVGFYKGQYKLFIPGNDYEDQIQKKDFEGLSVIAFYNILFRTNIIMGISFGYERQNNYQTLEEVEITDTTTVYEGNGTLRTQSATQKVRKGDYLESNYMLANFDVLWIPGFIGNRIGIDLFGRYDSTKDKKIFKPGIGLFIVQKGAPTKVIGGITFETIEKKLKIGLFAGFNF